MTAPGIGAVVDELVESCERSQDALCRRYRKQALPSRDVVVGIVEDLRSVLFPGYFGMSDITPETLRFHVGSTLDRVSRVLRDQVNRGICFYCEEQEPERCTDCERRSREQTQAFLERLPRIRRLLETDVVAAYQGDPAASSPDEAIFCYPGILAISSHRIAHELDALQVPLIPRMIAEHAHSLTGIDIHPAAEIGESVFIDHGTGVVIGETSRIGDRVRIYQGVTLGARSFPLDELGNPVKGIRRHPRVEDDVVIYSGATILGDIVIGRGSVIGGNVWLTRSVAPGSRVTQAQVRREDFGDGGGI